MWFFFALLALVLTVQALRAMDASGRPLFAVAGAAGAWCFWAAQATGWAARAAN